MEYALLHFLRLSVEATELERDIKHKVWKDSFFPKTSAICLMQKAAIKQIARRGFVKVVKIT